MRNSASAHGFERAAEGGVRDLACAECARYVPDPGRGRGLRRRSARWRGRGRGSEGVVRDGYEVERVPAIVADLDERLLVVGLDDGPDRSGGPAAGVGEQLDDVEHGVSGTCHMCHCCIGLWDVDPCRRQARRCAQLGDPRGDDGHGGAVEAVDGDHDLVRDAERSDPRRSHWGVWQRFEDLVVGSRSRRP